MRPQIGTHILQNAFFKHPLERQLFRFRSILLHAIVRQVHESMQISKKDIFVVVGEGAEAADQVCFTAVQFIIDSGGITEKVGNLDLKAIADFG